MEVKLDMHCHSIASDGECTIPTLAILAKNAGLDALVITDHSNSYHSYFQNLTVLDTLQRIGHPPVIPVIVGSEIGTPYGEFLLFGSKAIKNWYRYKNRLKQIHKLFDMEAYFNNFYEYVLHSRKETNLTGGKKTDHDSKPLTTTKRICKLPYAMFIPHPEEILSYYLKWPEILWDSLHGFEIQNNFTHYDECRPEVVDCLKYKIKKPWLLRTSDCHNDEVGRAFNTFQFEDGKEINEGNLIHCILRR
jgi:hypothetical protein